MVRKMGSAAQTTSDTPPPNYCILFGTLLFGTRELLHPARELLRPARELLRPENDKTPHKTEKTQLILHDHFIYV